MGEALGDGASGGILLAMEVGNVEEPVKTWRYIGDIINDDAPLRQTNL